MTLDDRDETASFNGVEGAMIRYTTSLVGLEPRPLGAGFFEGWTRPPDAERHLRILLCSDHVVIAMDSNQVVGFVTAITDGMFAAFIPLLEVLPRTAGRARSLLLGLEKVCS